VVSAEDQRLREAGLAMTYIALDQGGVLLAEELSGTWQDYVYLNGRLVSVVKAGQVYAAHGDQTGRTLTLTNASQAVVWQAEGLPFTTPITTNSFGAFNFEFPGQYEAHGHTHNGYREYNGYLGRYAQSDPIGLAGGINTYAYVGDNPISRIDPLGLAWQLVVGGGGTVIVPFLGGGAYFNVGINIDGLNSSIYIQDQGNLAAPTAGGAYAGLGLNASLSHADAPTTGTDSEPYLEADAGNGPYSGGVTFTKNGCGKVNSTGVVGVKPGVGIGLGAFSGTTYTSTAVSPTLQSVLPYLYVY